jgi:integrase
VDDATVEATLPHLGPVVRDMVQLQRLTGMRPGEVCGTTWAEIDTAGAKVDGVTLWHFQSGSTCPGRRC